MELAAQRIGRRIQHVRKEKGLTQTELGKIVGKSESTIRKYEAGAVEPSFKVLNDICKELKIEMSYFLSIEDIAPGPVKNKEEATRRDIISIMGKISGMLSSEVYSNKEIENEVKNLFYLYKKRSSLDMLKELIVSEGYDVENINNEALNEILKRVSSVIEIELYNLNK